jgi:hypothetical protein
MAGAGAPQARQWPLAAACQAHEHSSKRRRVCPPQASSTHTRTRRHLHSRLPHVPLAPPQLRSPRQVPAACRRSVGSQRRQQQSEGPAPQLCRPRSGAGPAAGQGSGLGGSKEALCALSSRGGAHPAARRRPPPSPAAPSAPACAAGTARTRAAGAPWPPRMPPAPRRLHGCRPPHPAATRRGRKPRQRLPQPGCRQQGAGRAARRRWKRC